MTKYILTEIGYDSSVESVDTLIEIAQQHSKDLGREEKITTFGDAVEYFINNGFTVEEKEN